MIGTMLGSFVVGLIALLAVAGYLIRVRKRKAGTKQDPNGGPKPQRFSRAMFDGLVQMTATLLAVSGIILLGIAIWIAFVMLRGPGKSEVRELAAGIRYERVVERLDSGVVVCHLVSLDLAVASPEWQLTQPVTDGADAEVLRSRHDGNSAHDAYTALTVDQFAQQTGVDLAINASYFTPFYDRFFLWFHPDVGDPVSPIGPTWFDGASVGPTIGGTDWAVLAWETLDRAPRIRAARWANDRYAVSGQWLLRKGDFAGDPDSPPYPRTIVAFDAGRTTMWLLVIDGKTPRVSVGMTERQAADWLIARGAANAMLLDGGGSSTLVLRDELGEAYVANLPTHTKIPGYSRPVANHLGLNW